MAKQRVFGVTRANFTWARAWPTRHLNRAVGCPSKQPVRWLLAGFGLLLASCATTPGIQSTREHKAESMKTYWKAVSKPNSRYYIVPRPELTAEFPTPEAINNLTRQQAQAIVSKLNDKLQFTVAETTENGDSLIRITPEPHLEDIVQICVQHPTEQSIQDRCRKELKWASDKARPDIYLRFEACEAVFFARQLNNMYQKPQPEFPLCKQ